MCNCTGSPCTASGACLCLHPSNEPDCSVDWVDGAFAALLSFIVIFSLVFGALLVVAAAQLTRRCYLSGLRPNVPKLLHLVILVQAVLRLSWFLSGGLDVLGKASSRSVAEGVLDGLGVAMLVVCYLLCILLWLHVLHQISPPGQPRSSCLRHRTLLVAGCIALYLAVEIAVRVVWNASNDSSIVLGAIVAYHLVVLVATLLCTLVFVAISVQLYRLLREADRTPASRERMSTMMGFTSFTLAISGGTLLFSVVFFAVEISVYRWANWDSWLVEQTLMRSLEAAYSIGTLWFLRKIPPHEVIPERRSLLPPAPGAGGGGAFSSTPRLDDSSVSVEEDVTSARRKLSSSLDTTSTDI